MTWLTRQTEALTTVREAEDDPRAVEGVAVPYGVVSPDTEFGREAFAPGAFASSVDHWMGRQDGARLAFRPAHGKDPVGVVTVLRDTPDGVQFRAVIDETPEGDGYLRRVRSGLNGVSIEAVLPRDSRRLRDGTVLHRTARLLAIAGSVTPAYDTARISIRDMDEDNMDTTENTPAPAPDPTDAQRDATMADPILTQVVRPAQVTITRPEPVYGPGTGNSYLRDLYYAGQGDTAAAERQSRHNAHLTDIAGQIERAGEVLSSEIPGAYPNEYLPGLLTPRILKGRPMGGFFQRVAISDAQPKIFPKVTTSTTVAVQSAEGSNPAASDFATTAVTATPLLYGAETVVSRQVLDGGSPAAESMILQDMIEAYAQASETVIKTAVEAGSSASGVAITAATPYAGVIGNVVGYYGTRFKPAAGLFIPSALYTTLLNQLSAGDGRPLMPYFGPQNTDASVAAGATQGNILGATTYLSYASTTNVVVTARPEDFVIFESSIARFSFDAVTGPSGVRMGIWAYLVVGARLGSLKVTAA